MLRGLGSQNAKLSVVAVLEGQGGGNPNQRCLSPRGRREWGDHGRRIEEDRAWQGAADGGLMDRDHRRWQGEGRFSAVAVSVQKHQAARGAPAPEGGSSTLFFPPLSALGGWVGGPGGS